MFLVTDTATVLQLDRSKHAPFKIAMFGENLKIFCRLPKDKESRRFYQYKWTKDGKVLADTTRYKIKRFEFLRIRSARQSDSGIYKCEVKTEHGIDSLTTKLNIVCK